MKVIGLTGGIGCGKTTIAGILEKHFSMKVIYTDDIAKEQMLKGGISYQPVVDEFSEEILQPDGEIDKDKLSEIIFKNPEKRQRVNELTHPNVRTYLLDMIKDLNELGTYKAVFIETALLIEAGYTDFCDEVWYVYAEQGERRERLKKSKNMEDAKIEDIFAAQLTDDEYRRHADKILNNSDSVTVHGIFDQISAFINEYTA